MVASRYNKGKPFKMVLLYKRLDYDAIVGKRDGNKKPIEIKWKSIGDLYRDDWE